MSTAPEPADFYLGRGADAQYLGSIVTAGAPKDIQAWERFQSLTDEPYTEKDYTDEVEDIRGAVGRPGWPWRYQTSQETPWTYMFDRGSVYVYRYGVEMAKIVCNYTRTARDHETREPRPAMAHQLPVMAAR